jgi:phosphatidate cytidylyltransferase
MARRILSTVGLWAVVFLVLWYGRTGGAVALATVFSVLALREFYTIQEAAGRAPFAWLGMFFGALITASPWIEVVEGPPAHPLLALATVVFAIRILGEREPAKRVEALASTLFGLVYVALLLQYLVRIVTPTGPDDPVGGQVRLFLCLWLVAVAKFCDVGALLTGLAIGRHHMAPLISPKKTWEGAAGGVAVSALVGSIGAWLGARFNPGGWPAFLTPGRAAGIAVPLAILAIISDLVESVVKRHAEVKDSGSSVPGIGGVLDVVDSLLLTAPVGYFLLGLA